MTDTALAAGDTAPDFTAITDAGTFTLSELRGKSVILFFYPAAMTPGCTTQACDFRDSLDALKSQGYEVVGISKDTPAKLAEFREAEGLTYTLVSDESHLIHNAFGAWGDKSLYGKIVNGALRSTFVVDTSGVLTFARYNVKATGHVAMLRRELGID